MRNERIADTIPLSELRGIHVILFPAHIIISTAFFLDFFDVLGGIIIAQGRTSFIIRI